MADDEKLSKADEGRGYHEVMWAGRVKLYQCNTCHYNNADEAKVIHHVENAKENADAMGR